MERGKRPFSLQRRPTRNKNRIIYYVQFRRQEGGYGTAQSTGQTSRAAAEAWAELKRTGGTVPSRGGLTLEAYAEPWWRWDRCDYIKRKIARASSISPGYAAAMRGYLDRWVLPRLGSKRLTQITTNDVEIWVMDLHEKTPLAPATVNHCLKCLRIMLREAERLGYVSLDPTRRVSELAEAPRQKTTLTLEEVRRLFREDRIKNVWAGDLRHYGVRLIPLPTKTARCLRELVDGSPYREPEDLVFHGADRRHPIGHREILDRLYLALGRTGVGEEERARRNVCFHSWRVWFNSLCRLNRIPDSKLRRLTGHRAERMTELYTAFRLEDFRDVLKVQEATFRNSSPRGSWTSRHWSGPAE